MDTNKGFGGKFLRIIAGTVKGRPIQAPKGTMTRPTLDRVKESLFSIIQFSIAGARVLDLYSGSGNLALEALSRGAAYAVCNDQDANCCAIIRRNIQSLGFTAQAEVLQADAMTALRRLENKPPFDLVFLDPPYKQEVQPVLFALFHMGLIAQNGRAIVEHGWARPPEAAEGVMWLVDRRKYGDTGISFFERTDPT